MPGIMNRYSMINYRCFYQRDELAHELAATIGKTLEAACAARGEGTFIAAGGNTPIVTYRTLNRLDLPWEKVTLTLTDERWVAPYHPDSNEAMLRRELLHSAAASARFISLMTHDIAPEEAEPEIENRLNRLSRPFDLVMLGMGEDGHIASLLPQAAGLTRALDPCSEKLCKVIRCTSIDHPRMTLTAGALLQTRRLILLFFGYRKRGTFERALRGQDVLDKPVRILLNQERAPLDVYWAP